MSSTWLSQRAAQKLMVEALINDISRRAHLDGRIVNLTWIIVRPDAPSAAPSSFANGIIKAPLNGKISILPVSKDQSM